MDRRHLLGAGAALPASPALAWTQAQSPHRHHQARADIRLPQVERAGAARWNGRMHGVVGPGAVLRGMVPSALPEAVTLS